MKTIEVEVKDEWLSLVGEDALKQYLRKQAKAYAIIPVIEELAAAITASDFDYDEELKTAKEKAWNIHKQERYPNLK